jgi:hypothetical protein
LFTIACAVRKHVYIPRKVTVNNNGAQKTIGLLGAWDCYPNIYVVLVGDPGIARKTTTMSFGEDLLTVLSNAPAAPTDTSKAALVQSMVESPDGSLYIAASELATLISRSEKTMFEFLVDGYDVARQYRGRTTSRGVELVGNPCLNMFACTQPTWIKENMPPSIIGGGFSSRTLFVREFEPRALHMYYTHVDYDKIDKIGKDLIDDLEHIATIKGEFKLDDDMIRYVESWYREENHKLWQDADPRLKPYYARRHVHAHKIAMLLKLSRSDELRLTTWDFQRAVEFLEDIEGNMPDVFGVIGKNEYTADIDQIRDYMKLNKEAPQSLLYYEFQATAEPQKLNSLINFLLITKEIEVKEVVDNEPVYTYRGKHSQ